MSELNEFSRAELLLGEEGIEKLRKARVAVFGIGGVGSFVAVSYTHLDVYKRQYRGWSSYQRSYFCI